MAEVKAEEWVDIAADEIQQRVMRVVMGVLNNTPDPFPTSDLKAIIARAYAESGQQNYEAWITSLPKCLGDEIGCEGNLVGMPHEEACPMFGKQFATMRDAFEAGRRAESERDEYQRGWQEATRCVRLWGGADGQRLADKMTVLFEAERSHAGQEEGQPK
jgi:hypothetical protein